MKPCLYFILLIPLCLLGQSKSSYVFSLIDSNNGLSENRVRSISQLPDGRMLIGTEGLMNIYDGTSFNYIHADEKNIYQLLDYDGFRHVYSEANGNTWIKNNNKLQYLDIEKETFVGNIDSIFVSKGMKKKLTNFFMDTEYNFWCPNVDGELYYYNLSTKQVVVFVPSIRALTLSHDLIYDIVVYEKQLFIFFKSGLMICFDMDTRKELYRDNPIKDDWFDQYKRTLLVVRDKHYLYQVRNGINNIVHRYDIKNKKWELVMQAESWMNILSVDSNNNIWICGLHGLWIISEDLQQREYIPKMQLVDGKFIDTEISTFYHDHKNGLWVGSLNRGLLYYHPDRFKFKNIGYTLFDAPNTSDLRVQCFAENGDKIVVGSQRGLFVYDKDAAKLKLFDKIPYDAMCSSLYKDSRNRIWLSTLNKGLFCITGNNVKQYTVSPKVILDV